MKVYVVQESGCEPIGVFADYDTALAYCKAVNGSDFKPENDVNEFPVLTEVSTEVFDDADVK